jgi:hypothetical protein
MIDKLSDDEEELLTNQGNYINDGDDNNSIDSGPKRKPAPRRSKKPTKPTHDEDDDHF